MKIVFLLSIALANANIRDQLNCAQAHYVKWAGSNPEDYPSGIGYVWGFEEEGTPTAVDVDGKKECHVGTTEIPNCDCSIFVPLEDMASEGKFLIF